MKFNKSIGILVHPSSLPGGSYCGTFGEALKNWINCLSKYKINTWQFLPLSPTDSSGSPYNSPSSFALNPWFLDVDELIKEEFINKSDLFTEIKIKGDKSNFFEFKIADKLSKEIGNHLVDSWEYQSENRKEDFSQWCKNNTWVNEYSLFMSLKGEFDSSAWWNWPKEFRNKKVEIIHKWKDSKSKNILEYKLIQWHLNRQWLEIKKYAKLRGIRLIGDLPFYVSKDSEDVWSNKSLFSISDNGDLFFQSGVPPDYFSSTGQLWGTPVYSWSKHESTKFNWWRKRFRRQFDLVDILRLDHFRAMSGYWSVEGKAKNAINGKWIKSPGKELLSSIKEYLGFETLPIIAEDLGVITKDVIDLRTNFKLPGMKILQFAFDGNENNPYLPKNIIGNNWVIYTGTHDNPTTVSWWQDLDEKKKEQINNEFNISQNPNWDLMALGMQTEASLFIAPIQDVLELDDSSRLNKPGTIGNNWKWKIKSSIEEIEPFLEKYAAMGKRYSRI